MGGKPADGQGATVLVVEDDVYLRLSIADYLQRSGFTVLQAHTADDAVELMDAGRHVDLVFSDVQMPGSMDGFGLAQHLRRTAPAMPVILTSGALVGDTARGWPFFAKPYNVENVVARMRELLD